jgi:hypothetical protein
LFNFIIIALILTGLIIHRYLSDFWVVGTLPYPFGFIKFANWFALTYLISFIWLFGLIPGVIVSALCFFQIIHSSVLWIISVPMVLKSNREQNIPTVNKYVYSSFSTIIITIAVLTLVNFFYSHYGSVWELLKHHIWVTIGVLASVCVIGNIARFIVMSIIIED